VDPGASGEAGNGPFPPRGPYQPPPPYGPYPPAPPGYLSPPGYPQRPASPGYQPGYQPGQPAQPGYQPGQPGYPPGQPVPPGYPQPSAPLGYQPGQPGYPPGPPVPPGYPQFYPPAQPVSMPPPLPPARRPRRAWATLGVVVTIVAALAICAGTVAYTLPTLHRIGTAVAAPTPAPTNAAAPIVHSPTLNALLTSQATALLGGDEKGFLSAVDPSAPDAVDNYRQLYRNLRALHVTSWAQRSPTGDLPVTTETAYSVEVTYCLLVKTCDGGMHAELHINARSRDGGVLIDHLTTPASNRFTSEPRPWEVSSLHAVVGDRVIVAASSAWASQLPAILPIAQSAAATAGGFAHWGKPAVYIVYLASASEGRRWFAGELENVDGVAYTIDPDDIEVVAMMPTATNPRYAGPGALNTVLRHEFGHVATLHGMRGSTRSDSFAEGLAEYCAYADHTAWASYRIGDVHDYLRSGAWSGSVYLTSEVTSGKVLTASAAYGIGYLAIRRFVAVYGLTRTLDFWGAVERDNKSLKAASTQILNTSWDKVNADAAAYVRRTARA
jgi:hypothetical protein